MDASGTVGQKQWEDARHGRETRVRTPQEVQKTTKQ